MFVKLLSIDFLIPGCSSLKEKRFVLASIKTRIRQRFNVAVSEVDFQDKWQRCRLGVVTVGPDKKFVDTSCDKVLRLLEREHRIEILDIVQELR